MLSSVTSRDTTLDHPKEGLSSLHPNDSEHVSELDESRTLAVRFLNLKRSLQAKGQFDRFAEAMREDFTLNHAESVPVTDLHRPSQQVFYMPMHAVHKELSTTTNIRVG